MNNLQIWIDVDSSNQPQEIPSVLRIKEWRGAVDVSIIIAAFLLCFLPSWPDHNFPAPVDKEVSPKAIIIACYFIIVSAVCNPIYSMRKRKIRITVKKVLRQIGLNSNVIKIDNNENNPIAIRSTVEYSGRATHPTPAQQFASLGLNQ